jgi:cbb3-type cytochrome oxidase subunit 3
MNAEVVTHNSIWPQLMLVFFFAFFLVAVFVALSERRQRHLRHMAQLPLDDGSSDHA